MGYIKVEKECSLLYLRPDKAKYWSSKNEISPEVIGASSEKEYIWECPECGYEWKERVSRVVKRMRTCRRCSYEGNSGTSFGEQFIYEVFKQIFGDDNVKNRSLELGFEIDILVLSKNIGIEYGAWAWHKDKTAFDKQKIQNAWERGCQIYCIYDGVPADVDMASIDHAYILSDPTTAYTGTLPLKEAIVSILAQHHILIDWDNFDWDTCEQSAIAYMSTHPLPPAERSIAAFPEIAAEWDYEKNGLLTPDQIFSGSSMVYWWKCSQEHGSYLMSAYKRTGEQHCGCPICACKQLSPEHNSFAAVYPHLLDYWDYDENPEDPAQIFPTDSHKIEWHWKCSKCGHKWQTVAAQPVLYNDGEKCPRCQQADRLLELLPDIHLATRRCQVIVDTSIAQFTDTRFRSPERPEIEKLIYDTIQAHADEITYDRRYWYIERPNLFVRISKVNVQAIQEFYLLPEGEDLGKKFYDEKLYAWRFTNISAYNINSFGAKHPDIVKYFDEESNGMTPYDLRDHPKALKIWHWKCPDCGDTWTTGVPMSENSLFFCRHCFVKEKISKLVENRLIHFGGKPKSFTSEQCEYSLDEIYDKLNEMLNGHCEVDMHAKFLDIWGLPEQLHICVNKDGVLRLVESGVPAPVFEKGGEEQTKGTENKTRAKLDDLKQLEKTFANTYPQFLPYWDYNANEEVPDEIPPTTGKKKIWHWVCPDCGHKWTTASAQKIVYDKKKICPNCRQGDKLLGVLDELKITSISQVSIAPFYDANTVEKQLETIKTVVENNIFSVSFDAKFWYIEAEGVYIKVRKQTHVHTVMVAIID